MLLSKFRKCNETNLLLMYNKNLLVIVLTLSFMYNKELVNDCDRSQKYKYY